MEINKIFDRFNHQRVLVIGDVMIDAYLRGKVSRISPEAPVPIVNLEKSEDRLGGAANVALNLVSLGVKPIICSVIGNDANAKKMQFLFEENQVSTEGLILSPSRKTTVKMRVIGNNQQLLRVDDEQIDEITKKDADQLIEAVANFIANGVDGIIFEDYNKGVLSEYLISSIIKIANENKVITVVDPKKDNFLAYKNVTMFKPNLKELKEGLNCHFDFKSEKNIFENAISLLEKHLQHKISFVTLSEHGVFIKQNNEQHYINAHLRNIADVSGAGDTVIAVATACLIAGCSLNEIAQIANIAGGLVCEVSGVVPITKEQLINEVKLLLKN